MTGPDKRQQNALHAWALISDMMQERGAEAALYGLFMEVPETLVDAVTWLARQPLDRRKALCEEFFGPIADQASPA